MAASVTVFAGKGKTGTHSRLAADGTDRNGYTGGSGPPACILPCRRTGRPFFADTV